MNDIGNGISGQSNYIYSSSIKDLHNTFYRRISRKEEAIPFLSIQENNESGKPASSGKWKDFCYKTGLFNTTVQLAAGALFLGLALFGKKSGLDRSKIKSISENYIGTSKTLADRAERILGLGYLIGAPAVLGAGINTQQPGTVLSGLMWFAAAPFMLKAQISTRVKGFLALGYAPTFIGLSNEIDNHYREGRKNNQRKMNLDFFMKKDTYTRLFAFNEKGKEARAKFADMAKFVVNDQIMAIKTVGKTIKDTAEQTIDLLKDKRKKAPDIFSTEPSKESMCLGSLLIILGTLPKIIKGSSLGKMATKASDFAIGAGLLFESIGMITLANKKEDSRRLPALIGGPMRIVGDFGHENPFLFALRTFGGAGFEYYYTLLNKEKDGKVAPEDEPGFVQLASGLFKNIPGIPLRKTIPTE